MAHRVGIAAILGSNTGKSLCGYLIGNSTLEVKKKNLLHKICVSDPLPTGTRYNADPDTGPKCQAPFGSGSRG